MKGWLPKSVDEIIGRLEKDKGSKFYTFKDQKTEDEEIKEKKDGEV